MCGIAGLTVPINSQNNYPEIISGMVSSLSHRGPDAQKTWHDDGIHLGHARLSIIDLSENSNQPLHSSDNRFVIVYNGELYNYRELKLELQRVAQGSANSSYFFNTNSDTEVILAAYKRWGKDCLEKFNGMFAFAIYDRDEKSLFIARDRLGIKPLYYSYSNDQLIFASEIRAILRSGLVEKKMNRNVISEYFLYQTVHAPNTIIEGIKVLLPGNYMLYKNHSLTISPFWKISSYINKPNELNYNETCNKVNELLFQAVERRLVADVPFGAFLSGGIDSSAIVGIMSRVSLRKVETFNVSFDESDFSEAKYAAQIAKNFETNHHEIKLKPIDFLKEVPGSLSALDHPSGDGANTYVVSKATKQAGVTMALSGLGGDELFAGYDVFKRMMDINRKLYLNVFPQAIRKWPAGIIKFKNKSIAGDKIFEVLSEEMISIESAYPVSRKSFSEVQINKLLKNYSNQNSLRGLINHVDKPDKEHILSFVSALEMSSYMQNVLLRDTDQMSMSVALEVRVPFLDHKLVEFVLSVKDEFKYPSSPKKLLVDSLKGLLPAEVVNRPKMGFTLPWKHWLKNELKQFCELNIVALSARDFVNEKQLLLLWEAFLKDDKRVTWSRIWHLVVFENWMQKNNIV